MMDTRDAYIVLSYSIKTNGSMYSKHTTSAACPCCSASWAKSQQHAKQQTDRGLKQRNDAMKLGILTESFALVHNQPSEIKILIESRQK
jgi:GTP cyclohydrolase FolE2